jgi:NADH-quinone oxidoreductase subunit N
MLMLPEIIVVVTAVAVLVADMFLTERGRGRLSGPVMAGLAAAAGALLLQPLQANQIDKMLGGQFTVDNVAWWFRLLFILAGLLTVVLSSDMLSGRVAAPLRPVGYPGEYYAVLLLSISGMMYLIAARDLLTLYVSLELATIPLFALAAWRRGDARSGEAGLKYVIIGAMASAMILYGLGIFYGLTGTMALDDIGRVLRAAPTSPAMLLAATLTVAGAGFKLTIVPFHMWAADVYEGAPTPVTAFLSVGSKAAGLALMFQVLLRMLGGYLAEWQLIIALFAAATMTLGNVVAIVQQNIKRFMAFSAISQAGYLILGFLGPAGEAVPAMLFYFVVYLLTNMTVFACIVWYGNETGREQIPEYRGLSRTNPLMALAMMLGLFSLAGIPPLSGFVGKFFLFSIASRAGFHWLVAVAGVNSTISLYYYLRVVRQMYIEPVYDGATRLPVRQPLGLTVGILSVSVVLLGIIPSLYETIHAQTIAWLSAIVAGGSWR